MNYRRTACAAPSSLEHPAMEDFLQEPPRGRWAWHTPSTRSFNSIVQKTIAHRGGLLQHSSARARRSMKVYIFVGAHPVGDGRGTRPQQHRSTAPINSTALQTIAHGVGFYIMRHRRMAGQYRGNPNFMRPGPSCRPCAMARRKNGHHPVAGQQAS